MPSPIIIIKSAAIAIIGRFRGPGTPTLGSPQWYILRQTNPAGPPFNPSGAVFAVQYIWQAPTKFGPGATAITEYETEYQSFPAGGGAHAGWVRSGNVNAPNTRATESNIPLDNYVRFRVRAINNAATPKRSRWLTFPTVHARISQGRALTLGNERPLTLGSRPLYLGG